MLISLGATCSPGLSPAAPGPAVPCAAALVPREMNAQGRQLKVQADTLPSEQGFPYCEGDFNYINQPTSFSAFTEMISLPFSQTCAGWMLHLVSQY